MMCVTEAGSTRAIALAPSIEMSRPAAANIGDQCSTCPRDERREIADRRPPVVMPGESEQAGDGRFQPVERDQALPQDFGPVGAGSLELASIATRNAATGVRS